MSAEKKVKQPITKGVAKVPVVMQMEALECGAASLAMILAYYGKWIPLEQVRFECGVSRDGSSAKNVLKAARSYGLTAKGYRYEPEDLKKTGRFPCIIHWNFNHFVVLDGFRGNKAVINDPAKGTYAVSMEAFDEAFTGISLQFEPSENFEPGGKPASVLRYAKRRLKGTGTAIAFVVLTTLISSLIGIINPAFSRIFMDRLLTGENPDWVFPLFPENQWKAGSGWKCHIHVENTENACRIFFTAHGRGYSGTQEYQCFCCRRAGEYVCAAGFEFADDDFLSGGYDKVQSCSYADGCNLCISESASF